MVFRSVRVGIVVGAMLIWLVVLAACGAAASPTPSPEPTTRPTSTAVTQPTASPEPTSGRDLPTPVGSAPESVLAAVRAAVATAAGSGADEVTILETRAVEFSSTALGCPEPGMMYAQVITPGYIVIAEAGGERYEFHTNTTGDQVVQCEPTTEESGEVEQTVEPAENGVVEAAADAVSRETGLEPSELTPVSTKEAQWPDSSLGCPQSDQSYVQKVTPGYVMVFSTDTGERYEVHTDAEGKAVVLCLPADEGKREFPETIPAEETKSVTPATDEASRAALEAVAAASGMAIEELEIVSREAVNWSDSSLGCPQPDQFYLQVIIPGFRFTIRAGSTTYEVHTDQGTRAVIC